VKQINKKLYNWASILEPNTEEQAVRTSSMPFIWHHYALMPDAHLGAGATVGSVIPTLGAIMPAAVGVDIGCGMIAVRTAFYKDDLKSYDLTKLRESIERSIPLSAGAYNHDIKETAAPKIAELEERAGDKLKFYDSFKNDWRVQLK
jgi:tRNA-splicing ligase RtcB (3'-phosphate/5'-hydroxy nucleic acid ligase)